MKFIIGPCAITTERNACDVAHVLFMLQTSLRQMGFLDSEIIYKSSFSKDTRRDGNGFLGVGLNKGMEILEHVKKTYGLRVTSDVHTRHEARLAAAVLDIIQIPHHLCRNTALIKEAARTGKVVSVKKGLHYDPAEFHLIVDKIRREGNTQEIIAIERGNCFGYNDVVLDMRNFDRLAMRPQPGQSALVRDKSVITCIDATHPVKYRHQTPALMLAGVAAGAQMVFVEADLDPDTAPCDGLRMSRVTDLYEHLLKACKLERLLINSHRGTVCLP